MCTLRDFLNAFLYYSFHFYFFSVVNKNFLFRWSKKNTLSINHELWFDIALFVLFFGRGGDSHNNTMFVMRLPKIKHTREVLFSSLQLMLKEQCHTSI